MKMLSLLSFYENGIKVKVSKKLKNNTKISIKVTLKNGNTKTLKIRA
jgi:hypothetical protein